MATIGPSLSRAHQTYSPASKRKGLESIPHSASEIELADLTKLTQNASIDSFQSLTTGTSASTTVSPRTSPWQSLRTPLLVEQLIPFIREVKGHQLRPEEQNARLEVIRDILEKNPEGADDRDERGIPLINYALAANIPALTELLHAYEPTLAEREEIQQAQHNLLYAHQKPGAEVAPFVLAQLRVPGVNMNQVSPHGSTAVSMAAWAGREDVLNALLTALPAVNANAPTDTSIIPLISAARHGHRDAVRRLLDVSGIDMTATDHNGKNALHTAAEWNQPDIAADVLNAMQGWLPEGIAKFHLNKPDQKGRTALLIAAEKGHIDVVRVLLTAKGIDVNKTDATGKSPLIALVESFDNMCQAEDKKIQASVESAHALEQAANIKIATAQRAQDRTREQNAQREKSKVVQANQDRVANAQKAKDKTIKLWLALIQTLVNRPGIDMDPTDIRGRTAVQIAHRGADYGLVDLLNNRLLEQQQAVAAAETDPDQSNPRHGGCCVVG